MDLLLYAGRQLFRLDVLPSINPNPPFCKGKSGWGAMFTQLMPFLMQKKILCLLLLGFALTTNLHHIGYLPNLVQNAAKLLQIVDFQRQYHMSDGGFGIGERIRS